MSKKTGTWARDQQKIKGAVKSKFRRRGERPRHQNCCVQTEVGSDFTPPEGIAN